MIKFVFHIIAFSLILTVNSFAQEESDTTKAEYGLPAIAIKWSPYHLINTFPTIQIDGEFKIHDRWSFQAGGSPVIYLSEKNNNDLLNRRGFKLKSELRYYFLRPEKHDKSLAYITIAYDLNKLKNEEVNTYYLSCDDFECVTRKFIITERRLIHAVTHRIGWQRYLTEWMLLDLNLGWGWRWGNYKSSGEPENINDEVLFDDEHHLFNFYPDDVYPDGAIGIGVKLSVRIK